MEVDSVVIIAILSMSFITTRIKFSSCMYEKIASLGGDLSIDN